MNCKFQVNLPVLSASFVHRLFHHYLGSNFSFPIIFHDLNFKIRPLSYDPIVVYSILVERVYGEVSKGCSVVDIGAHVGIFSLYSVLSGAKEVFSFEPESRNFRLLEENVCSNRLASKIHPFKMGVWSTEGERTLFTSGGSAFHGFFPYKVHQGGSEQVRCAGINDVLEHVEPPVVLKIDAEGSEYEIVQHMTDESLEKVEKIVLEYHIGNPHLRSCFPRLLSFLSSRGFSLWLRKNRRILIAKNTEVKMMSLWDPLP